ncbi:response regulator [candidate division WOR-3 bacterium]|nr:response regulator [candidate division WOR-3 bacterium]
MEKILAIDDEEDILNLIRDILTAEGFEVETALSAEYGITLLERYTPDLVLLDLMLPGMDGWEFLKIIKSDERFKDVPVILLTCRGELRDKILGLESGAADYITKPFTPDGLIHSIRTLLKEKENGQNK